MLVPISGGYRVCDANFDTAHAAGRRGMGCNTCECGDPSRALTLAAAIAYVDALVKTLEASGFFKPTPHQ